MVTSAPACRYHHPMPVARKPTTDSAPRLTCHQLQVVAGLRHLVRDLTLDLVGGQFIAMLGQNGVGKTLTLHTLAGLRAAHAGEVRLDGTALSRWPGPARARRLSLLTQTSEDPFPATVIETALIGRHPHLPFWQQEGAADLARAEAALIETGLADLAQRSVDSLSGGERRRLAVATLLAQDPAVCLLDEPTNHLDPLHCREVLALFRRRADAGALVIASLHDPNLAARYADAVLLLHGNGRWQFGPVDQVLTSSNLTALYGVAVVEIAAHERRVFVVD